MTSASSLLLLASLPSAGSNEDYIKQDTNEELHNRQTYNLPFYFKVTLIGAKYRELNWQYEKTSESGCADFRCDVNSPRGTMIAKYDTCRALLKYCLTVIKWSTAM